MCERLILRKILNRFQGNSFSNLAASKVNTACPVGSIVISQKRVNAIIFETSSLQFSIPLTSFCLATLTCMHL